MWRFLQFERGVEFNLQRGREREWAQFVVCKEEVEAAVLCPRLREMREKDPDCGFTLRSSAEGSVGNEKWMSPMVLVGEIVVSNSHACCTFWNCAAQGERLLDFEQRGEGYECCDFCRGGSCGSNGAGLLKCRTEGGGVACAIYEEPKRRMGAREGCAHEGMKPSLHF